MTEVRERAAAKINLTLHVTGRRRDGYHLLESLVAFADVADELTFEKASAFSLSVSGPFAHALADDPDNLVLRAARATARGLSAVPPGAAVALHKVLPVAAGIGGGSADVAATIRGLVRLAGADARPAALHQLAAILGADVPVCLRSAVSLVRGVGESVTPAPPLPEVHAVLANPGVAVATADVFRALGAAAGGTVDRTVPPLPTTPFRTVHGLADYVRTCRNDLEAPARRLAPAIGDALDALEAAPGCLVARMSGSGATCFALFAEKHEAAAAAADVAGRHRDWWVVPTVLS